eukprot:6288597-Prymnesium_polylepis.1
MLRVETNNEVRLTKTGNRNAESEKKPKANVSGAPAVVTAVCRLAEWCPDRIEKVVLHPDHAPPPSKTDTHFT